MENQEPKNPFISIHTPVALVALALSVLFFSQIKAVGNAKETMEWQSKNVDKQIDDYQKAHEQLAKAIEERTPNATASADLQTRFALLMKKVNELAEGEKGDADAKRIIAILVSAGVTGINLPESAGTPKKDK